MARPAGTIKPYAEGPKEAVPPFTAIGIVTAAAEGLHAAHELRGADGELLGVVHRDVAPQNIMIGYDGVVRVMDFGVAKAQGQLHHSRPGTLKGTLAYMAPEQLCGAQLDRRGDIFSLGVILWEAIACKRLFKAKSDLVTGSRILKMEIPRLSDLQPECTPGLEEVVARALARVPTRATRPPRSCPTRSTGCSPKQGSARPPATSPG